MKQFSFKKRDKIIAAAAGAAIFIFVTGNFVFSTAYSKSQSIERQIRLEEANLAAGLEIKMRKSEISEELVKYKDTLDISQDASGQKAMALFSKEIEQIAQESGISIIASVSYTHLTLPTKRIV